MVGGRVGAVILAAGASTRLGEPKQLVRLGAETLLERTVRVAEAAGLSPVNVVLGAAAETIAAAVAGALRQRAELLINVRWAEGMASSIRRGVEALSTAGCVGAVVLTCDQPFVTAAHLRLLCERAPKQCTASAYAGRRGVPAYFPAEDFADLLQLRGEEGARSLLRTASAVELADGELDVDTPEALERVRRRFLLLRPLC